MTLWNVNLPVYVDILGAHAVVCRDRECLSEGLVPVPENANRPSLYVPPKSVNHRAAHIASLALPGRQDTDIAFQHSLASSPRRSHLQDAATRTIANGQFIQLKYSGKLTFILI